MLFACVFMCVLGLTIPANVCYNWNVAMVQQTTMENGTMVNKKTYSVSGNGIASSKTNEVTFNYDGLDDATVRAMCGPYEQCEVIRLQGVDRKTLRSGATLTPHTVVVREGRPRVARVAPMTNDALIAELLRRGVLNQEMVDAITSAE